MNKKKCSDKKECCAIQERYGICSNSSECYPKMKINKKEVKK